MEMWIIIIIIIKTLFRHGITHQDLQIYIKLNYITKSTMITKLSLHLLSMRAVY